MMKRLIPFLLLLTLLSPFARAADTLKEVIVDVGETVYARFEIKGKKMQLVQVSKTPDDQAQVVLSLTAIPDKKGVKLKVENRLTKELFYTAEIISKRLNLRAPGRTAPVVAQKVAYETYPDVVESLAAFDFKLGR